MNCKFCSNFVPEGNDSCPTCGRRPEEEPIGELLAKANTGSLAARVDEANHNKANKANRKTESRGEKKSIVAPLIALILGGGGWAALYNMKLFGSSTTVLQDFLNLWNNVTKGSFDTKLITNQVVIILGVSIIGIVGLVTLISTLISNSKE